MAAAVAITGCTANQRALMGIDEIARQSDVGGVIYGCSAQSHGTTLKLQQVTYSSTLKDGYVTHMEKTAHSIEHWAGWNITKLENIQNITCSNQRIHGLVVALADYGSQRAPELYLPPKKKAFEAEQDEIAACNWLGEASYQAMQSRLDGYSLESAQKRLRGQTPNRPDLWDDLNTIAERVYQKRLSKTELTDPAIFSAYKYKVRIEEACLNNVDEQNQPDPAPRKVDLDKAVTTGIFHDKTIWIGKY